MANEMGKKMNEEKLKEKKGIEMEIEEKTKHKYSHLHIVHRFCLMLFYGSRRREQKHTIQKQKWRRKNHSHTDTHKQNHRSSTCHASNHGARIHKTKQRTTTKI